MFFAEHWKNDYNRFFIDSCFMCSKREDYAIKFLDLVGVHGIVRIGREHAIQKSGIFEIIGVKKVQREGFLCRG